MLFRRSLRSLLRALPLALGYLIVAGCSAATGVRDLRETAPTPDFQTDSAAYRLRATSAGYEGVIRATYTNHSGGAAYFVNCNGGTGVELQKSIDGSWQTVWSPVLLMCLSQPITVAASASWSTAVHIFGGYPGTNYAPQFTVSDIPGTYRLVWTELLSSYQSSLPFGTPLPFDRRISNVFTLDVAPR
jgi:hypothetical protein